METSNTFMNGVVSFFNHPLTLRVIAVMVILAVVEILGRLITGTILRISNEKYFNANKTAIFKLMGKIIRYILYVIGIALSMEAFGISTAPILAIGSAVGVAVGLGAQRVVKDVISGFLILTDNQYVMGDVVKIEGFTGVVENISLLSTTLRNGVNGEVITIPNGKVEIVTNYSKDYMNAVVDLPIPYEQPIEVVLEQIEGIVAPIALEGQLAPITVLGAVRFDESAMVIRISAKMSVGSNWEAERVLRNALKTELEKSGIHIQIPKIQISNETAQ